MTDTTQYYYLQICERVRCPSQATRMFEKTDILKQGQDIYFRSISCHACCMYLYNHDSSQ